MLKKLALIAAIALGPAYALASQLPDYPFIHVNGSASQYVMPDIGTIDFEIVATDADPSAARAVVESRVAEVRALMEQQGMAADDVEVRDVRQEIAKDGAAGSAPVYEFKCSVHVNVRNLTQWRSIAGGLLGKPNLTGFAVAFDTSTRDQLETELTAMAVRDAQRRAGAIADGFKRKLGPVTAVTPDSLKNLGNAMGLVRADFTYRRETKAQQVNNQDILAILVLKLAQSVDVIFRIK